MSRSALASSMEALTQHLTVQKYGFRSPNQAVSPISIQTICPHKLTYLSYPGFTLSQYLFIQVIKLTVTILDLIQAFSY